MIVLRLHPLEPITGSAFTAYLNNLTISVLDNSFAHPEGEQIGQAAFLAIQPRANPTDPIVYDAATRIAQHFVVVPPLLGGAPTFQLVAVATAVIQVPAGRLEYIHSDVKLTISRNGKPVHDQSLNYNVDIHTAPNMPPPGQFQSIAVTSSYVALPAPERDRDPALAFVEMPEDGTPPAFADLLAAVIKVLNADPQLNNYNLTSLTPEQCKHIAFEIVYNRTLFPLPKPTKYTLEQFYTTDIPGRDDTDKIDPPRQTFEADQVKYHASHDAEADRLSRYIYSLSAALYCEQKSNQAGSVGFQFPVKAASATEVGKIKEVEVILTN